METGRLHLTIVTPERAVLERTACDSVTLPAELGEIQVLPAHTALVTLLGIGIASCQDGGKTTSFAVRGGFAEIAGDEVRILADAAVAPEGVDAAAVRKDQEAATRKLLEVQGEEELAAVDGDIRYAEARLSVK